MSSIRFTIQDYTSGTLVSTIVDEPVGLDKVSLHIARDKDYHGFADMVDDSLGRLQFYGPALAVLQTAYQDFGVDAHVECLIEFACADNGVYQQLYQGRFSFDTYSSTTGTEGCYAEIVIKNNYNLTLFRDRMDQKVSLDSLSAFDSGYPPLAPYEGLGILAAMQPMSIRMINYATIDTNPVGSQVFGITWPTPTDGIYQNLAYPSFTSPPASYGGTDGGAGSPANNEFFLNGGASNVISPFGTIRCAELGSFAGPCGEQYSNTDVPGLQNASPLFTYLPDIPYLSNKVQIDIELSIAVFNGDSFSTPTITPALKVCLMKGITWNDARNHQGILYNLAQNNGSGNQGSSFYPIISACTIDQAGQTASVTSAINATASGSYVGAQVYQYSFHTAAATGDGQGIVFNPGEQLFLLLQVEGSSSPQQFPQIVFFSGAYEYRNSYSASALPFTLTTPVLSSAAIDLHSGTAVPAANVQPLSYARLSFDSRYQATPAPVYMVAEAMSRIAEIITNGQLQVYSDYFGRSSASPVPGQPVAGSADGPAALTAITNGLLLRGYSPLQAYFMGVGQNVLVPVSVSVYTLNLPDLPSGSQNCILSAIGTSALTVTVPFDGPPSYAIGTEIIIEQSTAAAVVTVSPATGVSISAPGGIFSTTGLGSQLLLTNTGLNQWLLASRPPMFCSFRDVMDAMKNIYAVGFGLEADPVRSGYQRIRVEPISHFYNSSSTMLTCSNADRVKLSADPAESIATFECGYSKWEAEEAQGLDEFLTKRVYRTGLNVLRSQKSEMCKLVASGYAIEMTRRKLATTTTDWRYDKDIFALCLSDASSPYPINFNRGLYSNLGPLSTKFASERGGFASGTATRIIDPASVYDARISPARNALRWLPYLFQCYADPASGSLSFTEGDGNYYAGGKLAGNPVEAAPLCESQALALSDLAAATGTFWKNEIAEFSYPMGFADWLSIYNNPYGLVAYSVNGGSLQYGYLLELKYDLYGGMGEFKLKTAVL